MDTYLLKYFRDVWKPRTDYKFTGLSLADNILDHELVIDVGCGNNPYRGIIKNLVGIDPAFEQADVKVAIEDYVTDVKFDVALCLGSINFGSLDVITNQINCVVNLLKPNARIYWRCNPGLRDHGNSECQEIDFFPWSFDHHQKLCLRFGFDLSEFQWDSNNRIYAVWKRAAA